MNHSNQYKGNNPIPGPKRYGNSRNEVATATKPATPVDVPASTVEEKVTITSIDAKVDAHPDANVMTAANATEMAAQAAPVDATPGPQIVTDPAEPAASTRPTS